MKAILATIVFGVYMAGIGAAAMIAVPIYARIKIETAWIGAGLTGTPLVTYNATTLLLDNQVSWVLGILALGGVLWYFLTLGSRDYVSINY